MSIASKLQFEPNPALLTTRSTGRSTSAMRSATSCWPSSRRGGRRAAETSFSRQPSPAGALGRGSGDGDDRHSAAADLGECTRSSPIRGSKRPACCDEVHGRRSSRGRPASASRPPRSATSTSTPGRSAAAPATGPAVGDHHDPHSGGSRLAGQLLADPLEARREGERTGNRRSASPPRSWSPVAPSISSRRMSR